MKHTPGPWVWVDEYPINVNSSTGEFIATTTPNGRNPFQEDVYNARLIAAAPELLAALEAIATLDPKHDSEDGYNEWGEAECFTKAQVIAQAALLKVNSIV